MGNTPRCAQVNFSELHTCEVRRKPHRRMSGSVEMHISVTALSQQGTEAESGRLGVLRLMYRRLHCRPCPFSVTSRLVASEGPKGPILRLYGRALRAPPQATDAFRHPLRYSQWLPHVQPPDGNPRSRMRSPLRR